MKCVPRTRTARGSCYVPDTCVPASEEWFYVRFVETSVRRRFVVVQISRTDALAEGSPVRVSQSRRCVLARIGDRLCPDQVDMATRKAWRCREKYSSAWRPPGPHRHARSKCVRAESDSRILFEMSLVRHPHSMGIGVRERRANEANSSTGADCSVFRP